ncbi:MAG: serine hydrolase domain-containing protein [Planctomycetota bacterium]
MRRPVPLLLALLLLPTAARAVEPVVREGVGRRLDEHLQALDKEKGGFCGSALVAHQGEVLLEKGYGVMNAMAKTPMPPDAMWDWASVTKQFTAAAILKLEMKKKLRLEDSIRKHFPKAPKDKQAVKILHLLNHTSGIKTDSRENTIDWRSKDAMVRYALSLPLASEPGAKWEYSNLAYFLLAALVEKASGTDYESFCIEQLFRPAGMKEACFIGSDGLDLARVPLDARGTGVHFAYGTTMTWGYRGAGGAVVSCREMLAWDRALRADKLLSKAAKEKYYDAGLNDYALGWFVDRNHGGVRYWHSGAVGQTVTYYLRALDDDVVVALAHSEQPATHPEQTARELVKIVLRGGG